MYKKLLFCLIFIYASFDLSSIDNRAKYQLFLNYLKNDIKVQLDDGKGEFLLINVNGCSGCYKSHLKCLTDILETQYLKKNCYIVLYYDSKIIPEEIKYISTKRNVIVDKAPGFFNINISPSNNCKILVGKNNSLQIMPLTIFKTCEDYYTLFD